MKDRIINVSNGYTCLFMYKGFQVSFTTQVPQEVRIFKSKEDSITLFQSETVEEALDWINNQGQVDLSPYQTEPKDFTGCDPVVAAALKRGLNIWCEYEYDEGQIFKDLISEFKGGVYFSVYDHAFNSITPLFKKRKVLRPASEIMKWAEDNGYTIIYENNGDKLSCPMLYKKNEQPISLLILKYCGKPADEIPLNIKEEWLKDED